MAVDSMKDVQAALYAHLTGDTVLNGLVQGRIFDFVPQGTAFPYVAIGETVSHAFDTQSSSGNEMMVTLHVYSQARGGREAQVILARIREILHEADFAIASQILIFCRHAGAELAQDQDGVTRRGTSRFHLITEPL